MTTLVIHAPYRRREATSFEWIFENGVGNGYAISKKEVGELQEGSCVVLIRKDKNQRRAVGRLVKLVHTGETPQGIKRYDVYVKDWKEVPYKAEEINRFGVNLIYDGYPRSSRAMRG